MTAAVFKLNTANTTNLTKIKDVANGVLKGYVATNTGATAIFVKYFWYVPTAAAPTPTVGTTVPDITVVVPALGTTTGTAAQSFPDGLQRAGQLWMAVTNGVADNDTAAVAAGAGLISTFYE